MNISLESRILAREVGLRSLEPVIQRIENLEVAIQRLQQRIEELESAAAKSAPPHLRNVEKRS